MSVSYWEQYAFQKYDLIIIGGGIVGLSVAATLLENKPEKNVLILERGLIPSGASTKNGGISVYSDVVQEYIKGNKDPNIPLRKTMTKYNGFYQHVRRLGADKIQFENTGFYHILDEDQSKYFKKEELDLANQILFAHFKYNIYEDVSENIQKFGFNPKLVKKLIRNNLAGSINSGLLIKEYIKYVTKLGAIYNTGSNVINYTTLPNKQIEINVENTLNDQKKNPIKFFTDKLVIATNGFTRNLIPNIEVYPARGQILVTKPLKNLKFNGSFCFNDEFYYFKSFENRVIFGGGRNLDFQQERTQKIENTENILQSLKYYLKNMILHQEEDFEIEQTFAGIMGFPDFNKELTNIVEQVSENVYVGARLCGMGIPNSSVVALQMYQLMYNEIPNNSLTLRNEDIDRKLQQFKPKL